MKRRENNHKDTKSTKNRKNLSPSVLCALCVFVVIDIAEWFHTGKGCMKIRAVCVKFPSMDPIS
jgi:hypothetical protein